jgi:hypothetical protein
MRMVTGSSGWLTKADSTSADLCGGRAFATGLILCDEPVSDAVDAVRRVLPEFEVTEVPVVTGEAARLRIAPTAA